MRGLEDFMLWEQESGADEALEAGTEKCVKPLFKKVM